MSLKDAYKAKQNKLYSIALGNSLFGGFIFDNGACAYYYLISNQNGYGLLLNKAEYLDNKIYRLFFIPSLAPIATLFTKGEYFHPRTTSAILEKNLESNMININFVFILLTETTRKPNQPAVKEEPKDKVCTMQVYCSL